MVSELICKYTYPVREISYSCRTIGIENRRNIASRSSPRETVITVNLRLAVGDHYVNVRPRTRYTYKLSRYTRKHLAGFDILTSEKLGLRRTNIVVGLLAFELRDY